MIKVKDIAEKYGDYEVYENKLKELLVKPKPKTVWDIKVGDKYYYFGQSGIIYEGIWKNNAFDLDKLSIGNVFLTKEEAKFELERRKVETQLLKYGGTRDMMSLNCAGNTKYYIYYDNQRHCIFVTFSINLQRDEIYFKSEKDCWKAIKEIGEDRIKKYLFYVK